MVAIMCLINLQQDIESNINSKKVIVIMGAAVWEGGILSGVLKRRTHQAIKLFKEIKPCFIVFTGGRGKHPPTEAEAMSKEAIILGIPSDKIIVEKTSKNSFQSIRNVSNTLSKQSIRNCIVVTDSYHIFRCKKMFKDFGILAEGYPITGSREKVSIIKWYWFYIREFLALIKYFIIEKKLAANSFNTV